VQLFETEVKTRWRGSRELVVASSLHCVWCGDTFDVTYSQPALFYHGGYGATEGKRIRGCVCGAIRTISIYTLNPRTL
jgi:hypothetical protein